VGAGGVGVGERGLGWGGVVWVFFGGGGFDGRYGIDFLSSDEDDILHIANAMQGRIVGRVGQDAIASWHQSRNSQVRKHTQGRTRLEYHQHGTCPTQLPKRPLPTTSSHVGYLRR